MLFLSRNYQAAAVAFNSMYAGELGITDPDSIYRFVASLEELRAPPCLTSEVSLPDALDVSIKAAFSAFGDGKQHDAMGYKIHWLTCYAGEAC